MSLIADWLSSHTLLLLLSAGTLFSFLWIMQFRKRLAMRWYAALPIAVLHTPFGGKLPSGYNDPSWKR